MKPSHLRNMNWIGAGGWTLTGVALLINKIGAGAGWLITIIVAYSIIVYIPTISALAFAEGASTRLQRVARVSNWAFIALIALSFVGNVVAKQPLTTILAGLVFFVLPAALNVRGLRSTNSAALDANAPASRNG